MSLLKLYGIRTSSALKLVSNFQVVFLIIYMISHIGTTLENAVSSVLLFVAKSESNQKYAIAMTPPNQPSQHFMMGELRDRPVLPCVLKHVH